MSTAATVPMIGPDGSSADIPTANVQAALASGGKLAVAMTTPDGQLAYIPHENAAAAIKAGGRIGQPSAQEGYKAPAAPPLKDPTGIMGGDASIENDKQQLKNIGGAVWDQAKATGETVYNMVRHPIDNSIPGMAYAGAKNAAEHIDNPETAIEAAGKLGIDIPGAKQAYAEGNVPSAIQKIGNPVFQALILKKVGDFAGKLSPVIADTPSPKAAYEAMKAKPQMMTMEQMKQMSPRDVSGLEDIYRASAPTGKNPGFRDNLNAALPDLKKVASAIDLSESKGGIISPDMRVRATVKAINGQLENMYQTERVAQIQRNAGTPVEMRLNADARRGLEFLSTNAGESGTQQLAAAALKRGSLPIETADVLAQTANKYLKSYEKMTSEQKLQVEATNPKIGGLKELDRALGNSLNNTLTAKGEVGLRGYERRYAGLSAVRDVLQDRMNAAELDQPGAFKGAIRLASTVMKGKSGLLSASQASVADITAGKALESGFKKLSSGPKR